MKSPEEVHAEVLRIFKSRHRSWLRPGNEPVPAGSPRWPLEIKLGIPSRTPALEALEALRQWCLAWQQWRGVGEVRWAERSWAGLGVHRLPEKLRLRDASEVARFLNQSARWDTGCARIDELSSRWPRLAGELPRHFETLAAWSDADFRRLVAMLGWLESNPVSLLYPRQLPIAGLDSKWMEARRGLLTALIAAMREAPTGAAGFHDLCGLRQPPNLVRMRLLDAKLRAALGGLEDISIPVEHLARMTLPVSNLLIVENLQTGLALEDLPGTVALMRLGYHVEILGCIPWSEARAIYWGDLDTHGFAILDKARRSLPQLESVLMDEETLLANRELWGEEADQHAAPSLARLTPAEHHVFTLLRQNRLGPRVRLEQERIPWGSVTLALRRIMA